MFSCNYKKLRLSFNEFHDLVKKDMPNHGEFCLIELKDGSYTGGEWWPKSSNAKSKTVQGKFIRGTGDSIEAEEVAKWHSLDRYDLTESLKSEEFNWINLGVEGEGIYSVQFKDFKSFKDGDFPKKERYCLLIMTDGGLGAGRWSPFRNGGGTFIYAPALAQHSQDKVWAWTELSPDECSLIEEEREREKAHEEELNKNPSTDPELFKYGTDIGVYYDKALEKLREKYYWASLAQMKKRPVWQIVPLHGKYVFGLVNDAFFGEKTITEWTDGKTADEFIDFLCKDAEETVQRSNPEEKFKFGLDVEVYLEKAFENVKKDYRWITREMMDKHYRYKIKKIDGDWEYVKAFGKDKKYYLFDQPSAEKFIENVEYDYQNAALQENSVVKEYQPPFGAIDLCGWGLERYVFSKLQSGDYKVYVQAGDRVTGGGREFFITPYCFEAKTYGEFLDRYLEIVPGGSFGLHKQDLLPNKELKEFLGY